MARPETFELPTAWFAASVVSGLDRWTRLRFGFRSADSPVAFVGHAFVAGRSIPSVPRD